MVVVVRLFARAKDLAGADSLRVELPDGATVAALKTALAAGWPKLSSIVFRSAIAVDEEFATDNSLLSAGSVVALLPPVSGGSSQP
jgi:sulfur-carrier protein